VEVRKYIPVAFISMVTVVGLTSCFLARSRVGEPLTNNEIVMMASSVSDYRNSQAMISVGKREISDLNDADFFDPLLNKTIFIFEWTDYQPDGTIVTILKVLDDQNTPGDTEDDVVSMTRTYDIWDGEAEKVEKITRPRIPETDWSSWEGDTLEWQGDVDFFVDGVKVKSGTLSVTWKKTDGGGSPPPEEEVYVSKIVIELERIDKRGIIEKHVIIVNEDGSREETKYRVVVTNGEEVVVHTLIFTEIEEGGEVYTKIIKDDGSYTIVRNVWDPRIAEYYTPDDILRIITTEIREGKNLFVEKEFFNDDGELIETRNIQYQFVFLGDEAIVLRKIIGGEEITIRIEESASGYRITRNGFVYYVHFTSDGIEIYNENMELIAIVVLNDEGTWEVERAA
jgi:hypothetical protein